SLSGRRGDPKCNNPAANGLLACRAAVESAHRKENLMKDIKRTVRLTGGIVALALAAGCATNGQMGQGGRTAVGAGAGAALGAGLGALIGDSSRAAAIGAGIGAVAGGIVGYNWAGVKNDVEQSGATSLGVDVTEMPDGTLRVN